MNPIVFLIIWLVLVFIVCGIMSRVEDGYTNYDHDVN